MLCFLYTVGVWHTGTGRTVFHNYSAPCRHYMAWQKDFGVHTGDKPIQNSSSLSTWDSTTTWIIKQRCDFLWVSLENADAQTEHTYTKTKLKPSLLSTQPWWKGTHCEPQSYSRNESEMCCNPDSVITSVTQSPEVWGGEDAIRQASACCVPPNNTRWYQ